MDNIIADTLIQWFSLLEEDVASYLKYVPPINNNIETFSPRLATVIMEACELIDSIFRYYRPNNIDISSGITKSKKDYDIYDVAELYGPKINNFKVILLLSPPRYIIPFTIWSDPKNYRSNSPEWWQVYNKLKHSRIESLSSATLNIALQSLSGLLATMARFKELVYGMIRQQWLHKGGLSLEYIDEAMTYADCADCCLPFTFSTSLFAFVIGRRLPEDISDFHPVSYHSDYRLIHFLGHN